ncbi:MAG: outer membrane protein assembly factor BamB family protein [Planctomycetota bacterium]|jgi:outer membrane protein assembly factor BamB
MKILFLSVALTVPAITTGSPSDDWPQFRGPTGQGIAENCDPALQWSQTKNVTWKKPIPGKGWSSPVLYQGCVYLTTAIVDKEGNPTSLRALSIDVAKGDILWNREVFVPRDILPKHDKNSHASPTPLVEDDRIYVHFGHMATACLDAAGKIIWCKTVKYDPVHGAGCSPIIVDDKLIFSCDGETDAFVAALNKTTGDIIWKAKRSKTKAANKFSHSTSLLIEDNGRRAVICPGSGAVWAYNPDNGDEIWRVFYGSGFSVVPKPVHGHGMVFIGTGYGMPNLYAIRTGGNGDITETHLVWSTKRGAPLTPSMLLIDSELYFVSDKGLVTCVDAVTGKQYWQKRISGKYSASPVFANGRIYITSEKGKTHVIKADKKFKLLAENDLQEKTFASLALSDRTIFIRTESHLYRIEQQK